MKHEECYAVKKKDFDKIEKLAERIYNTLIVLDYFASTQQEIEELYNISPIVASLRSYADMLNSYFINYPNEICSEALERLIYFTSY